MVRVRRSRMTRRRRIVLLRRAGRVVIWTSVLGMSLLATLATAIIAIWATMRVRATRSGLVPAGVAIAFQEDADPSAPVLVGADEVRTFLEAAPDFVRAILVVPPTGHGPASAPLDAFRAAHTPRARRAVVFGRAPGQGHAMESEQEVERAAGATLQALSDEHSGVALVVFRPGSEARVVRGIEAVTHAISTGL